MTLAFGDQYKKWKVDDFKVPSACGLSGFISQDGHLTGGEVIIESMRVIRERGNGLGGGFAGYGIYPKYKGHYALHIMFEDENGKSRCEELLDGSLEVDASEEMPTKPIPRIQDPPQLWRYFAVPRREKLARRNQRGRFHGAPRDDYQYDGARDVCLFQRKEHGGFQGGRFCRGRGGVLQDPGLLRSHVDRPWSLPDQYPGMVGRRAPFQYS